MMSRFVEGQPEFFLWSMYVFHRRWFYAALVENAERCIRALNSGRYNDDMLWDFAYLPQETLHVTAVDWGGVQYMCDRYRDSIANHGSTDLEEMVLTSAYIEALIKEDPKCERYHGFILQLTETNILGV